MNSAVLEVTGHVMNMIVADALADLFPGHTLAEIPAGRGFNRAWMWVNGAFVPPKRFAQVSGDLVEVVYELADDAPTPEAAAGKTIVAVPAEQPLSPGYRWSQETGFRPPAKIGADTTMPA